MTLRIKSVKLPMLLKDLGFGFASIWGGRTYGADDLVPVADANTILANARHKLAKNG